MYFLNIFQQHLVPLFYIAHGNVNVSCVFLQRTWESQIDFSEVGTGLGQRPTGIWFFKLVLW